MNTLRSIIRMARANPKWARIALALDATIGLIVGLVVYLFLNLTEVPASSVFVLVFGALLGIIGIITIGYSLFITAGMRELNFGFSDEFDDEMEQD